MKALKAAVVIMGLLIVVGVTILIMELANRNRDPDRRAGGDDPGRIAETDLGLPDDAAISEMVVVGNRLAIRVTMPQGGDRVYLIDPKNGAVTATVSTTRIPQRLGNAQ